MAWYTAMNVPVQRYQWLTETSQRPMDEVRFVPEADAQTIDSIENGVLILMAFWSGTAVHGFKALSRVLATGEARPLEFVVVDIDGAINLCDVEEFRGKVHGNGETAWIHQGKIIATSGIGLNIECFRPNTSTLLAFRKYGSRVTPIQIATEFHWLRPWQGLDNGAEVFNWELAKELSGRPPLHGRRARAIAKRIDSDDVLFATDGEKQLAVVHLTWSGTTVGDGRFPATNFYTDFQEWVDKDLIPSHRIYQNTPL